MHLFHKWEQISKRKTVVESTIFGTFTNREDAIVLIEKCKVCSKRRAFVIFGNNVRYRVNPDLWE
jgi:hypothetical protein